MKSTHRLKNTEGVNYEDLQQMIADGARFVTYRYTISLLTVSLKRLTPIYYIPPGLAASVFKKTPNALSLLFGWWCIPSGPVNTVQSIAVNNRGGIDVTKDVMLNLSKEHFLEHKVEIHKIASPFREPNKIETKCLRKSLRLFMQKNAELKEVYFALFINVPRNVEPYFVLGLPGLYSVPMYTDELRVILYKSFQKHTEFVFIDTDEETELGVMLKEMGLSERADGSW